MSVPMFSLFSYNSWKYFYVFLQQQQQFVTPVKTGFTSQNDLFDQRLSHMTEVAGVDLKRSQYHHCVTPHRTQFKRGTSYCCGKVNNE